MRLLLLSAVLLLAVSFSPPSDDPCEEEYSDAIAFYEEYKSDPRLYFPEFVSRSQKARACLEPVGDSLFFRLLSREIFALRSLSKYQQALSALDELEARLLEQEATTRLDSTYVSWYYSTRANIYYYINDLNKAAGFYPLAIDVEPDSLQKAKYFLDFGNTFYRMRDLPSAHDSFNEAQRILSTITLLKDKAKWQTLYARTLFTQGDLFLGFASQQPILTDTTSFDNPDWDLPTTQSPRVLTEKAIDLLNQSLSISQNSSTTIRVLLDLARAYTSLQQPDVAQGFLLRAQKAAALSEETHWRYETQHAWGRFYLQTGQLDKAEAALQLALSMINTALHRDNKRSSLNALGLLYELQEEHAQADSFYQQAIDTTEAYFESLRTTDWAMQISEARHLPHRGRVRALLAQERYEDAFLQLAYSRARHLHDLRLQSISIEEHLSPLERTLYDGLKSAQIAVLDTLATDTLSIPQRASLKAQQTRLTAQITELLRLPLPPTFPSLSDLQHTLQPGQVLVSYFIAEKNINGVALPGHALSYAFVMGPNSLDAFPLATSVPDILTRISHVSPALREGQPPLNFDARLFSLHALKDLYDVLFAPLASAIPENARLIIIPDGPLFLLPFNMLVAETAGDHDYQSASYLIEKHAISEEIATTLFLNAPDDEHVFSYDLAAFGKSTFSDVEHSSTLRAVSLSSDALPTLSGVDREIKQLESLFSRKTIHLNEAANESTFFTQAPEAAIVHIASHTLLNGKAPLQNAVILSTDAVHQDDGFLYLHEIQRMRLLTRLVVLSGCNTARGVHYPGEGLAGLQYAFRAAGVPSTLATSWFVDDAASATLTAAFYRYLQRGLPKDVALQKAQIDYLKQAPPMAKSPFYWAAPVLYGDAASLDLDHPMSFWTLLSFFVFISLLLYLGWRFFAHQRPTSSFS